MVSKTARWHLGGWTLWAIAAIFYGYEFIHRVAPSILTEQLRVSLNINDHQLGTIGAMYFYAYAAFQLPAGVLIDRFGAKKLLVSASLILTLGSFIFATTSSILIAQISRFLIGMGSAFAFIGCLKIGAQWLTMSSFPLVVGLTNLCGTLGALSGGKPLSYLVHEFGWREVLMQLSFVGLFITLILWLFLEDKPQTIKKSEADQPGLLTGLITVMKNPQSWIIALYGMLLVAPIAAIPEMWGVEYLKVAYDLSATEAAGITHTIFIGTAIGGPIIGWIMTHPIEEVDFMMIASLGALILLCMFLYWVNMPITNLYIVLFSFGLLTANMLLCFSLITECHPPFAQGAAIGFINMVIMAGGGLAQDRVGWLLDKLRANHEGVYLLEDYHIALSVLPVCLLAAIGLTLFIKQKRNEL